MLEHAADLIDGDRDKDYGSPADNFSNIAELWTVRFKHKLKDGESFSASDVADAQILVKSARGITNKTSDTYTDIAGYAACAYEIEFGKDETTENVLSITYNGDPTELAREMQAKLTKKYRGLQ